jgi:hypothetical protein
MNIPSYVSNDDCSSGQRVVQLQRNTTVLLSNRPFSMKPPKHCSTRKNPITSPTMSEKRNKSPLKIAIIGIGHRGYNTHFLSIIENQRSWNVVAVCDTSEATRIRFASKHPGIDVYAGVEDLLRGTKGLDFAIVCLPHQSHLQCCKALARAGVHILKEKPVAESPEEYLELLKLPVKIGVTFQKRFEPRYLAVRDLLPHVGQIASFTGTLTASIASLDATWRAQDDVGVTVSQWAFSPGIIFIRLTPTHCCEGGSRMPYAGHCCFPLWHSNLGHCSERQRSPSQSDLRRRRCL